MCIFLQGPETRSNFRWFTMQQFDLGIELKTLHEHLWTILHMGCAAPNSHSKKIVFILQTPWSTFPLGIMNSLKFTKPNSVHTALIKEQSFSLAKKYYSISLSTTCQLELQGICRPKPLVWFKWYYNHLGCSKQTFFPYIDCYNPSGSPGEKFFFAFFTEIPIQIDFLCPKNWNNFCLLASGPKVSIPMSGIIIHPVEVCQKPASKKLYTKKSTSSPVQRHLNKVIHTSKPISNTTKGINLAYNHQISVLWSSNWAGSH